MTAYTYMIEPEIQVNGLFANSIEEAMKTVESQLKEGQIAHVCALGGNNLMTVEGKRAVNKVEVPFDCRNPE